MKNKKDNESKHALDLRRCAEQRVRGLACGSDQGFAALTAEDWRKTVHELQVHQVELEMQNDELRRSQEDLDRARACYFDLYDLAPVGYCTISEGGVILETNLAMVTMLGVARGDLLKRPVTHFVHKEDQDRYYLHRKQFYESGDSQAGEIRMVRADGSAFWAFLLATHIWKGASCLADAAVEADAPRSRLVVTDITWRKQDEERAAKIEAELHQTHQLRTIGTLAGGVAHVINNLLTAIIGNASLGSLAVGSEGKVASYFEAIEKSSQKAADLTSKLIAYAGKGRTWVTEVDLNVVVQEVLHNFLPTLPTRVVLRCELADRLPFLKGDASQVSQLLENLLSNAVEAFGKDLQGQITIRTHAEAIDSMAIASGTWAAPLLPGRYATLEVADSGAGMTPEVQARAFEPFFTTNFTGRGLGLAAVMGIICSHSGGLSVQSELGRGSSFKIYLPAMQEARGHEGPADLPQWRGEGKLLVADEDHAMRGCLRHMAERLGFSVLEARGGREAIDMFRLCHGDLALVLLDLKMPRVGGPEAFQAMRKIDGDVPVVLTSAYDAPELTNLPEGLAGTIKKPYRIAEVQGLFQRALA